LRGYDIWDGRRTTLRAAHEPQMSARSDKPREESIHIELLPKRATDQPVSGIALIGAMPLREPRGRLEAFELVEVVVTRVLLLGLDGAVWGLGRCG
jgi:hypothetical protein